MKKEIDIIVTSKQEIEQNHFSQKNIFHIALEEGKIIYDQKIQMAEYTSK